MIDFFGRTLKQDDHILFVSPKKISHRLHVGKCIRVYSQMYANGNVVERALIERDWRFYPSRGYTATVILNEDSEFLIINDFLDKFIEGAGIRFGNYGSKTRKDSSERGEG